MGARPLRRAVQRYVEDPLAELLLGGTLKPGKIKVSEHKDGHLTFKQQSDSPAGQAHGKASSDKGETHGTSS